MTDLGVQTRDRLKLREVLVIHYEFMVLMTRNAAAKGIQLVPPSWGGTWSSPVSGSINETQFSLEMDVIIFGEFLAALVLHPPCSQSSWFWGENKSVEIPCREGYNMLALTVNSKMGPGGMNPCISVTLWNESSIHKSCTYMMQCVVTGFSMQSFKKTDWMVQVKEKCDP